MAVLQPEEFDCELSEYEKIVDAVARQLLTHSRKMCSEHLDDEELKTIDEVVLDIARDFSLELLPRVEWLLKQEREQFETEMSG